MTASREKVVVAMSGGVDSSVAACLLVEQGYEVIGLFMRVGNHAAQPVNQNRDREGAGLDYDTHAHAEKPSDKATRQPGNETTEGSEGYAENAATCNSQSPNRQSQIENRQSTRAHQGCCSASDAADARFVAGMFGLPFYALNFEKDFDALINHFADEYARGRTPNPCVVCNDKFKFGRLFEYADAVGAKYVATGHYARIDRTSGQARLLRGVDRKKDQSYVLFGLRQQVLDRIMFPIGDMTKDDVRRIAAKYNLPNQDKPDSVEICFVPDRNYARVVRERRPDAFADGEVVDAEGSVIGRHEGIANYTIGQRRGLKIAAGKPIYVTQLDVLNNRVVMGDGDALLAHGLTADRVNLLCNDLPPSQGGIKGGLRATVGLKTSEVPGLEAPVFRAHVKIRYLHEAVPATVQLFDGGRATILFDDPQRAVTPGQAVVFYDGDTVLGGAWIDTPIHNESPAFTREQMTVAAGIP